MPWWTSRPASDDPAMRAYRYQRIDVFTARPFGGNPLAVFPTATGLDDAEMQTLARELNLSETTFVLPPVAVDAEVRIRIFTIDRELPLAGHPVVGTVFALSRSGSFELQEGRNEIRVELAAGVMPVFVDVVAGEVTTVFMTQCTPTFGEEITDANLLAQALGLEENQLDLESMPARVVDTGIPWLLIPVRDRRALTGVRPDARACAAIAERFGTDLVHVFTQDTGDPSCAVRTRHVWWGTVTPGEDPVTGSAIGCIASYMVSQGVILAAPEAEFTIEQGEDVGRPGQVTARVRTSMGKVQQVQVGGRAVHVGNGEIWL
jgi:trans-2,3-dihydro-3-hydroxyanthranilate isomerase